MALTVDFVFLKLWKQNKTFKIKKKCIFSNTMYESFVISFPLFLAAYVC